MWLFELKLKEYTHAKTLYGVLLVSVLYTVTFFSDPDKVLTPEMVIGNYTFFMAIFGGILVAFHAMDVPRNPVVLAKPSHRVSLLLQHFGGVAFLSVLFTLLPLPVGWHYYPHAGTLIQSSLLTVLFLLSVSALCLIPGMFLRDELRVPLSLGAVFALLALAVRLDNPGLVEKLLLPPLPLGKALSAGSVAGIDVLLSLLSISLYLLLAVMVFERIDLR
ncbi:hypothetical protein [Thermococcus sp. 21S7]|uniref:hypothetical protein n=1 Tax=Thermococcus sp. 21S7 TaxID=1638221 RepID=UPI0014395C4F|nr:hypothetical protein [Thermococcus sp. 21S7]NJE62524.1 hypothetical protein [Thermococcus sp. 21S7]